jgi:2-methylcitrate dehydratase PrpD
LSAEQMANALSTAAAQAAGLREMFGSMSKSLHAGKAAANGLYAALLARRGWVSTREGLEGRRG